MFGLKKIKLKFFDFQLKSLFHQELGASGLNYSPYDFINECSPPLLKQLAQRIETLVAIEFSLKHVCWIKLSKNRKIEQWTHENIDLNLAQSQDIYENIQKIKKLVNMLPLSDVYVLEMKSFRPTIKNVKLYVDLYAALSMAAISINLLLPKSEITRLNNDCYLPNIYSLKDSQVSKFYQLNVGGERISSIKKAQSILSKFSNNSEAPSQIDIEPNMLQYYIKYLNGGKTFLKEQYSNTLLLGLMFLDNIIFGKA
ncbi:unnamed protein product [Gordionus sp. m RMFG-2023]